MSLLRHAINYGFVSLIGAAALAPTANAEKAYWFKVTTPVHLITASAGESQSTVVPPGLKPQCPKGRFLVTNDRIRPPREGTVFGRDLNNLDGPNILPAIGQAIVDDLSDRRFGTNDHDIVSLSNGDVLLIWGVHSKAPLNPKPAWFDFTYSNDWGPGVRRGVMVWRSTDCAQSFQYVGEIDSAKIGDGSCAMPQPANDQVPVGNGTQPNFSNGGTDGQLVKVDLSSDKIYISMGCEGFKRDTNKPGFILSDERINKALIVRSTNRGTTWKSVGTLPNAGNARWRIPILPLQGGAQLAFGMTDEIFVAVAAGNGYQFQSSFQPAPQVDWGWDDSFYSNPNTYGANSTLRIRAPSALTRAPGSKEKYFLMYHATLKAVKVGGPGHQGNTYGYEFVRNDGSELRPIGPKDASANSFVMQLTAIDPGAGPVLLYWYDINGATKKGSVRGRFVFNEDQYSPDFDIAVDVGGGAHLFDVIPNTKYWYGDYKTAGGYGPKGLQPVSTSLYRYFPQWVEPDGAIHFSEVVLSHDKFTKALQAPTIFVERPPKFIPLPTTQRKRNLTDAKRQSLGDDAQITNRPELR